VAAEAPHQEVEVVGLAHERVHAAIDVVGTFWFDATPRGTASDDYSQSLRDEVDQAHGDPDPACGDVRVRVGFGPAKYALVTSRSVLPRDIPPCGPPRRQRPPRGLPTPRSEHTSLSTAGGEVGRAESEEAEPVGAGRGR